MSYGKKSVIENDERLKYFWKQVEAGRIKIEVVINTVDAMLRANPLVYFVDAGEPKIEEGRMSARHKRHLGRKGPAPKKIKLGYIRECVLAHLYTVPLNMISHHIDQLIGLSPARSVEAASKSAGVESAISRMSLGDPVSKSASGADLGYTDLFDDELYDPANFSDSVTTTHRDHLNTLRFQILLSILFDKQIVVPEQWAVSSATFMHVAGEVLQGYKGREIIERPTMQGKSRYVRVKPPFLVHFLRRDTRTYRDAYLKACISRLGLDSRVRLPGLLGDKNDDNVSSVRDELRHFLIEKLNEPAYSRKFDDDFRFYVGDILQCDSTAQNFATVTTYLSSVYSANKLFDEKKYHDSRLGHVNDVWDYCHGLATSDVGDDDRIREIKDFFARAKRAGVYGDVMQMWPLANYYSEKTRRLIQKVGQYTVHSAFSSSMQAGYGSLFYQSFSSPMGDADDCLDQRIIDGIRKMKLDQHAAVGQGRDFHMLAMKSSEGVDLGDTTRWPVVWQSVWEYGTSEEWADLRKKLGSCLSQLSAEKMHEHAIWEDIFSAINRGIGIFRFVQHKADRNRFVISLPTPASGIKNSPLGDKELHDSQMAGPIPLLAALAGFRHRQSQDLSRSDDDYSWRRGRHQVEA